MTMIPPGNRHNISEGLNRVMDSRRGDILMPALHLAQSVRDLTPAQLQALVGLLYQFERNPNILRASTYLDVASAVVKGV